MTLFISLGSGFLASVAIIFLIIWMIGQVILGLFIALLVFLADKRPFAQQPALYFAKAAFGLFVPIFILSTFIEIRESNASVEYFIFIFSGISVLAALIGGLVWANVKLNKMTSFYD